MDTERLLWSPEQEAALRDHRRQAFWQIWLPIILGGIVFIALTVLLIVTTSPGGTNAEHWANISAIWLLIPSIILNVVELALLAGLIYLMTRAIKGMPGLGQKVQYFADRMAIIARNLSDKAASPVLSVNGWRAGWREFLEQVRTLFRMI
ncbi:MAG TPA: hypothetical protein VHO48_11560 [Anaerolineaceae bacterium]|nr:hypothetical protein [Anaerolineaceae bacterium]